MRNSVGYLIWSSRENFPDVRIVVDLVIPQPGENCLDSTGAIKEVLDPGLCVGVDCVREILKTDARAFLEQSCSLHPNGTPDNQEYLVETDITAVNLRALLRDSLSLNMSPSFGVITAVNPFTTVPEVNVLL